MGETGESGAPPGRGPRASATRWARRRRWRAPTPSPRGSPATPQTGTNAAGLTQRELDVLRLLVAGRSNQAIADGLFISRETARTHVANIFRKLDVGTRAEAVDHAHRHGLALVLAARVYVSRHPALRMPASRRLLAPNPSFVRCAAAPGGACWDRARNGRAAVRTQAP